MKPNVSFNCPRCGEEPEAGILYDRKIYHDHCIVEDLVEKFYSGTSEIEIRGILAKIKNNTITNAVSLGCSWLEYNF